MELYTKISLIAIFIVFIICVIDKIAYKDAIEKHPIVGPIMQLCTSAAFFNFIAWVVWAIWTR